MLFPGYLFPCQLCGYWCSNISSLVASAAVISSTTLYSGAVQHSTGAGCSGEQCRSHLQYGTLQCSAAVQHSTDAGCSGEQCCSHLQYSNLQCSGAVQGAGCSGVECCSLFLEKVSSAALYSEVVQCSTLVVQDAEVQSAAVISCTALYSVVVQCSTLVVWGAVVQSTTVISITALYDVVVQCSTLK